MARESANTRDRLLEAACLVFAERGFREATIAEICKKAGANIAAVNYHFHNKETLYVEAWRLAFQRSLAAHPPDGGVPRDAPAEARLRGRVLSIMRRIADPKSLEFAIVHKELARPTGLLAEVMRESIDPMRREMEALVRELLGDKAPPRQVHLCQMSILAQCFDLVMRQRRHKVFARTGVKFGPPPLDVSVEAAADHIMRFSLAGIREVRRQIESGRLRDRE